jgi:hypothetical protein
VKIIPLSDPKTPGSSTMLQWRLAGENQQQGAVDLTRTYGWTAIAPNISNLRQ